MRTPLVLVIYLYYFLSNRSFKSNFKKHVNCFQLSNVQPDKFSKNAETNASEHVQIFSQRHRVKVAALKAVDVPQDKLLMTQTNVFPLLHANALTKDFPLKLATRKLDLGRNIWNYGK